MVNAEDAGSSARHVGKAFGGTASTDDGFVWHHPPGVRRASYEGEVVARQVARQELFDALQRLEEGVTAAHTAAHALNRELAALDLQRVLLAQVAQRQMGLERPPKACQHLSPRQRQVAVRLASGASDGAIARALGITVNTVKTHVRAVLEKLNVRSRREVAYVYRGVDSLDE